MERRQIKRQKDRAETDKETAKDKKIGKKLKDGAA
jgi:hypothetical protein